jgi:hypothetical protein
MQNFSVSKSNFINSNKFETYYVDIAMSFITSGTNITSLKMVPWYLLLQVVY